MEIKLQNVDEGTEEAKILKRAIQFYDHFATIPDVKTDDLEVRAQIAKDYWSKENESLINFEAMYAGTHYERIMHELLGGIHNALHYKYYLAECDAVSERNRRERLKRK